MKIVFIGSVQFSYRALVKLFNINANIVGVVTKEKSSFNSDFCDLSALAIANDVEYKYETNINSVESVKWLKSLAPDVIFCFGWSNLIKREVLNIPSLGVIGFHPTNLPMNRGRHPLIWPLVLGLKESASTFFFMNEGADNGDILSQKFFDIDDQMDAGKLYNKVTNIALEQIQIFHSELKNNSYNRIKQEHAKSNLWRKRSKSDGLIDFRMNSKAIYNLVRALTNPYVGAHIEYKGEDIKVWATSISDVEIPKNIEYGKVLDVFKNRILVKSMDSAIWIDSHEFKVLPEIGEYL